MTPRGPIAILGATSQIARDFVTGAEGWDFHLFARSGTARPYSAFGKDAYSAIINFVGVGDPVRAREMGAEIFTVTRDFDLLALDYLKGHPTTRYIFLSSGAIYGRAFAQPVNEDSRAATPVNDFDAQDWYGAAKLYAEALHRSRSESIIDIRIFNYISRTMNLAARFLVADMINAARGGTTFKTDDRVLMRDFLHPTDFRRLVECCLQAPAGVNLAVDAYSRAPISKSELITLMTRDFAMKFEIVENVNAVNATGNKQNYYSKNRRAAALGYEPVFSAADAVREEAGAILEIRN